MQLPIRIDYLLVIALLVAVFAVAVLLGRPVGPRKTPIMKQVQKVKSAVDKGRTPPEVTVRSRLTIVTRLFEEKMEKVGLEPSSDSGYIPVSQTPFASFLAEHGVNEDTIGAILAELKQIESESGVAEIIDAVAETPGVVLEGADTETAVQLAIEEWQLGQKKPQRNEKHT
ncbi:MAG: hypothetical protein JSW61_09545 [Candidatus Thorarchaeota archaeon]|nr:MAG: hypothetical protein JSW61_09545 [Candidatus Thorarchaeota archaeon]